MPFQILTLNAIAQKGLDTFDRDHFTVSKSTQNPDAILVRSANMHHTPIASSVEVIGRAGVGVNTIPVEQLTNAGVPVLNAPGANANAVKELVLTGMLLACRHICRAWSYAQQLEGDDKALHQQVEANKKSFSGVELPNRTLGIIGLGNIGVKVANAALNLGMNVIGFDNSITVQNAWNLSSNVRQAHSLAEVCAQSDFITLHIPLIEQTHHLINAKLFRLMKPGVVLLNFARDGIIDNEALEDALTTKKVSSYVCDFPNNRFKNNPSVIALPHLGASTLEAEENCAVMVAENVQKYLNDGTIRCSVNFPNVSMPRTEGYRLSVTNSNVPNIIAQISTVLSDRNINILDMINKSRNGIAYNLVDIDNEVTEELLQDLLAIEGVIRARKL